MAVVGEIASSARAEIPVTWDVLLNDPRYGDSALQRRVDGVKRRLFGVVVDPEDEAVTYDPLVLEYAGKLVALSVIPAGADYWAAQMITEGSGERLQAQWSDRAESLWKLQKELIRQTREMLPDVEGLLGAAIVARRARPRIGVRDGGQFDSLTQDPFKDPGFGREYAEDEDAATLAPTYRVRQ